MCLFNYKMYLNQLALALYKSILKSKVSTAILNLVDIFRSWCKLNFRPLRGHVKSRCFTERIHARDNNFTLCTFFLEQP